MDQPGPAGSVRVRRWVAPPVAPRHLSQCQRKHRFPDNNKDFGLTRLCDLHSHGSRTDGDLVLSVISPPWPTTMDSTTKPGASSPAPPSYDIESYLGKLRGALEQIIAAGDRTEIR